ncbi:hypothetical protein NHH48_19945, partial [Escherichia albertii]|nr:hypothetical protein [Escherichia albertii]
SEVSISPLFRWPNSVCHFIEQIPEIRDSFDKVAKRVPAFKGILNEWDSLVALLKSEMKIHGNKAPETYRRISELRKD